MKYEIVDVNEKNLDQYDLFCQKTRSQGQGYRDKLSWVKQRFKEGLRLKLLRVQEGKNWTSRGFIEYIPGEHAWRGIEAPGYLVIHCFWVVGKHKNQGYGSELLEICIEDARTSGMLGVATLTSDKHFLHGPALFEKHGFERTDKEGIFAVYALRFDPTSPPPTLIRAPAGASKNYPEGLTFLISAQCPYNPDAVQMMAPIAKERNLPVTITRITSARDARAGPHPYGTFCVLLDGKPITYHHDRKAQFLKKIDAALESR